MGDSHLQLPSIRGFDGPNSQKSIKRTLQKLYTLRGIADGSGSLQQMPDSQIAPFDDRSLTKIFDNQIKFLKRQPTKDLSKSSLKTEHCLNSLIRESSWSVKLPPKYSEHEDFIKRQEKIKSVRAKKQGKLEERKPANPRLSPWKQLHGGVLGTRETKLELSIDIEKNLTEIKQTLEERPGQLLPSPRSHLSVADMVRQANSEIEKQLFRPVGLGVTARDLIKRTSQEYLVRRIKLHENLPQLKPGNPSVPKLIFTVSSEEAMDPGRDRKRAILQQVQQDMPSLQRERDRTEISQQVDEVRRIRVEAFAKNVDLAQQKPKLEAVRAAFGQDQFGQKEVEQMETENRRIEELELVPFAHQRRKASSSNRRSCRGTTGDCSA